MPLYEFHCPQCGKDFEELVATPQAAHSVACPQCGVLKVERKWSAFAARGGVASNTELPTGACGRCGDPRGSCGA